MSLSLNQQIAEAEVAAGDTLLVAVSGGVDSVVLLHLLASCADRFELQLQVAHLNHRIRPESSADATFVSNLSQQLKLPCIIESIDVPKLARQQKLSLEMAARQARREFLQRTAKRIGARLIALAHHRDDQVETFLLRLLRGSGSAGLGAMRSLAGLWWRPLLDSSREQIFAFARQQQLEWSEDHSNADPQFLRNRLRHQLVPELCEINPRFAERTAEFCRQFQDDEDYWQQRVAETLPKLLLSVDDGLRLDRSGLLELPAALRSRILREAVRRVRGNLHRLEAVHLQSVERMLQKGRSQAQLDLPDCWVARRYETLWLREQSPVLLPQYDLPLPIPGELELPCGRWLRAKLVTEQGEESATQIELDDAELTRPLHVRNWLPGDFLQPFGMPGSKKLKRMFGDRKLELEARRQVPLLVCGERILWVAGVQRSRYAPVTGKTAKILRLELLPNTLKS